MAVHASPCRTSDRIYCDLESIEWCVAIRPPNASLNHISALHTNLIISYTLRARAEVLPAAAQVRHQVVRAFP